MMEDSYSKYCDAREALDRGDVESAERLLLASLAEDAHFKTHELLGDICSSRGDNEDAFNHIASAHSMNPRSDSAATRYARALSGLGRSDEARSIVNSVLERNPSYGPARQLLDQWTM
jgi:predicted Zn-dependent protease